MNTARYKTLFFAFVCSLSAAAQQGVSCRIHDNPPVQPIAGVNVSQLPDDWSFTLVNAAAKDIPEPGGYDKELKRKIDEARVLYRSTQPKFKTSGANTAPLPQNQQVFTANSSNGTPNDNSVAISNSGKIVSVVNTNVRIYDENGNSLMPARSLSGFSTVTGGQLGTLNRTYDPRVIYDPIADRFIIVFLQGVTSEDSRIIVGFSQTNDPLTNWKWYALQGNRWGDSTWFDYPIVSISKNDLFITGNILKDGKGWKDGFTQSVIWQVKLQDGYTGAALTNRYYDSILYNRRPIWSLCAVQGGSTPYGPETFFISMRPGDARNDTVFLHAVSNTLESGKAQFSTRILKSDKTYGLPPSAIQPSGQYLQTNDARSLHAIIEQGVIYFAGNTIDTTNFSAGVYFGKIRNIWGAQPQVTAQIISYDTLDIGYPSMTYAGGGPGDQSLFMTFSHVSSSTFPGTSVVFIDRFGAVSTPLRVRSGEGSINLLTDSNERWGDYTGIQRKYNETGVCWLSGSFGSTNGTHPTCVAKIKNTDPKLSVNGVLQATVNVYPNPAITSLTINLQLEKPTECQFQITDVQGRVIKTFSKQFIPASGSYQTSFDVSALAAGTYYLQITSHESTLLTRSFVVAR
jgi:hypothetical protein